jgi:hypothetical protein
LKILLSAKRTTEVNRKPSITESAAKKLATDYIAQLDLKGWRYEIVDVRRLLDDRSWSVLVDSFSPEGTLVDGPVVFVIDADDGSIWTLEEWIVRKSQHKAE